MADGKNRQAVHFASLAAARVSAMRYFVDRILWLNGEGETMEDLTGGRYADWEEIGAINYASVYTLLLYETEKTVMRFPCGTADRPVFRLFVFSVPGVFRNTGLAVPVGNGAFR